MFVCPYYLPVSCWYAQLAYSLSYFVRVSLLLLAGMLLHTLCLTLFVCPYQYLLVCSASILSVLLCSSVLTTYSVLLVCSASILSCSCVLTTAYSLSYFVRLSLLLTSVLLVCSASILSVLLCSCVLTTYQCLQLVCSASICYAQLAYSLSYFVRVSLLLTSVLLVCSASILSVLLCSCVLTTYQCLAGMLS